MTKKFEVGKVYKVLDGRDALAFKVCDIINGFAIICTNYLGDFDDEPLSLEIKESNGVEILESVHDKYSLIGSADQEIVIEEDPNNWNKGKEYEAICLETNQKFKAKLLQMGSIAKSTLFFKMFCEGSKQLWCTDKGECAFVEYDKCTYIIFKHGINSVLNWKKFTAKSYYFKIGDFYVDHNNVKYECKAIIERKHTKVGIFYCKDEDLLTDQTIYTKDNVEFTRIGNFGITQFIANEMYRHLI